MISDFALLGIAEDSDLMQIKKAYRAKAKELHPDTMDESQCAKNHFLFVEICKAYERLIKSKPQKKTVSMTKSPSVTGCGSIVAHSDPAYVFYRTGSQFFERIHPSHWDIEDSVLLNAKNGPEPELQTKKIKDLMSLFPKAYYYFSIVVHEYPGSVWTADSIEKMAVIERRLGRYRKIIESFLP
jgi:hypothetical protein